MGFKENSMNWIGVTVGGLVGIVGAILALKDAKVAIPFTLPWSFATDNSSFEKSLFVPGLQNLQNNCFLNVVLQALASCFCFQSFLHSVIGECGSKDLDENMPLALALATLLEELSSFSSERVTLSPRKMMLAMSNYIPNFNLTSQQDASEAFLHLLCLLREEFGGCYAPKMSSLAEIFASNNRILTPIQSDCQSEQERWQQLFLGPFDGILGSSLTCQSCSSQVELEKLRRCSDPEICDCRKMYNLDKLPWSNRFSHTLKQLSMARCPRILCIQLKRVYMNVFGELVKLQGHISFPLILDVLSFMTTRLGVKKHDIDVQSVPLNLKYNKRIFFPNHSDLQSEISTLKFSGLHGAKKEQIKSDGVIDDGLVSSTNGQTLHNDTVFPCSGSSESIHSDTHMQSIDQVDVSCNLVPQETCLYQLVSVVEHFGKAGSGHYTVYRSVRVEFSEDVSDDYLNQTPMRWFCISDSQVHAVSVEDVLSSEASLLFYERIPRN
ncbi:hypothetical protein JHK82_021374 [Glycine max]|nr:hypothetical protein JHK82_021374 [Glycine max]